MPLLLLSISLPALLTVALPASVAPNLATQLILFGLLLWLGRELRLFFNECLIKRRASALGGVLAPKVYSRLPFGLSHVQHRLNVISKGTPLTAIEPFKSFPSSSSQENTSTKVIRFRYLGIETIYTNSHLDAKYILTTSFEKWGKSKQLQEAFKPLFGDGVFVTDQRGIWFDHRNLTRPHFTRERVSDVVEVCLDHSDRVVFWLEEKSKIGQAVDIQDIFSRFTLTVGTQHLFGECVDMLNDLFMDRVTQEEESIDATRFSRDFSDAQEHCLKLLLLPPFAIRIIQKLVPDRSIKGVFKVVDGLISKTQKKSNHNKQEKVEEEDQKEHLIDHLNRSGFSIDLIRQETLNILLAARDTTASLLTSCIFELAGRDELWNKLKNEIPVVVHQDQDDECFSVDNIRKLKFLRAVINEVLRLHPPVWANTRHAYEDDILPSGIFVPAGTDCRFFIREFQRDPKVWGKDAEMFVPERWIDGRQIQQSKDPFSFQPFSAGPRICLGQQFAYTEVSIALLKLVRAFKSVQLMAPRESFNELPGVTLSIRGGLWVKFQR